MLGGSVVEKSLICPKHFSQREIGICVPLSLENASLFSGFFFSSFFLLLCFYLFLSSSSFVLSLFQCVWLYSVRFSLSYPVRRHGVAFLALLCVCSSLEPVVSTRQHSGHPLSVPIIPSNDREIPGSWHEEIDFSLKSVFMVDVRFELTTNDPWSVDDAICERQ